MQYAIRTNGTSATSLSTPEFRKGHVYYGALKRRGFYLTRRDFVNAAGCLRHKAAAGNRHNHSIVENVKGNWKALVQWLVIVWVIVAFVEEIIYRGFLMTEIATIVGMGGIGLIFNLILSSVIFGLSHSYQGPSGALSTAVIGFMLGVLFVWSNYNLWLPILTHGFIDTVGIGLIALGGDEYLKDILWRKAAV